MSEEVSKQTMRERYLMNFENVNAEVNVWFGADVKNIGERLVDELKKEDLTHDSAYACLQYAYNLIKFESNFLKLE